MDGGHGLMGFVIKEQWHTVCRRHTDAYTGGLGHHTVNALKQIFLTGFVLTQKLCVDEPNFSAVSLSGENKTCVVNAEQAAKR